MITSDNILLVEAQSDKDFIERLLENERQHNPDFLINVSVEVAIPTDFDKNERTNKNAVLKQLPIILKSMNDGRINRLGIIIDMDSESNDPFTLNINQIERALDGMFKLRQCTNYNQGLEFVSTEYDYPIGVWLMPNNNMEGYLETWIASCISDKQTSHYDKAEQFVETFQAGHFSQTALTKAKVYTWLAVQPKPRNDLRQVLNKGLIDTKSTHYQNFIAWLLKTFS